MPDALQSPSSHTTPDPSAPNGTPNGPELPRVAPPTLEAAEAPSGAAEAPVGHLVAPRGSAAVLDGEPDAATTTQWCKKCTAMVLPVGKGRCPRCNVFLRLNFGARKHPVNILRRDALRAELVSEFSPATIVERSACEHLAAAYERLDAMRPGSPEWQRLVTVAQTLSSTLHEARLSHEMRTPTYPGTDAMPTSALELARTLLTRLAKGEMPSEFERGQLDVLRGAMRGELVLPDDASQP